MKLLSITVVGLFLCLTSGAADLQPQKSDTVSQEWAGKVTDAAQLNVESNAWGTLQWICNEKLMPGAEQTVGLATTFRGQQNPVHFHPNCEEVLYVISGKGLHSYDGRTVELKPGMTIRIPAKVKHNLVNTGDEPLKTLISFSSGNRQTVFLEKRTK